MTEHVRVYPDTDGLARRCNICLMPSTVSEGRFFSPSHVFGRSARGMLAAQPQVSVEPLGGSGAERNGSGPAALADHEGDSGTEIYVVGCEVGELGQPDPGIGKQQDDRGITTGHKVPFPQVVGATGIEPVTPRL